MIRAACLASALLLTASAAGAQDAQAEQDALQAKYEKKVSDAWFVDNGFTDDYDLARERARDSRTPIFVYFTRSYAP